MNEATVDSDVGMSGVEWNVVTAISVVLAALALLNAVQLLRADRTIADEYMAATQQPQRDTIRRKHEDFRTHVVGATIAAFTIAGLYASVALLGMALQSYRAVDIWFGFLALTTPSVTVMALFLSLMLLCNHC